MATLDQIFFWSVVLVTLIEVALFVIIVVRKKEVTSEEARKVVKNNTNLFLGAVGLLIVALLFEFIGEIGEIFEYPAIEFLDKIHMAIMLVSLILFGLLTYKMARSK